jgi:hypothetical protein
MSARIAVAPSCSSLACSFGGSCMTDPSTGPPGGSPAYTGSVGSAETKRGAAITRLGPALRAVRVAAVVRRGGSARQLVVTTAGRLRPARCVLLSKAK